MFLFFRYVSISMYAYKHIKFIYIFCLLSKSLMVLFECFYFKDIYILPPFEVFNGAFCVFLFERYLITYVGNISPNEV